MNSAKGKMILALVREGNYAHPGEELAIRMALDPIERDAGRQVLDLGCGLGGTADYVRRHGFGTVTGVDIDDETVANAAGIYPEVGFVTADAGAIGALWQERFDLIYLFNSFYAFPDQPRALSQMRQVARPGAELVIFEYTDLSGTFREQVSKEHAWWTPIDPVRFPEELQRAGWQLTGVDDITGEYLLWYRELLGRIESKQTQIIAKFGGDWYDYVHATYFDLLTLVERNIVGGAVFRARRPELP